MSQQLINHSRDLCRLVEDGFAVRVEQGYLIVEEVPYLDKAGNVRRGVLACPIDATDQTTIAPKDHVISFAGEFPHDHRGQPISGLGKTSPRCGTIGGIRFRHAFSNKPKTTSGHRGYHDYHEKVTTYVDIIVGAVQVVDKLATARVGALQQTDGADDAFVFPDSASARAGLTELVSRFRDEVVAIIGLGGTGSYILDHVAKVPVSAIHLIDGDRFYPHNAFRAPCPPSRSDLMPPPFKVDYFASQYSKMKNGIVAHPVALNAANLQILDGITFAFLSMDANQDKSTIVAELERRQIPFVDVGMGLHMSSNGIGGTLRAVLSTKENRDWVRPHVQTDHNAGDDIYGTNIQISELNSQNANMAIQLWKTHRGIYADFGQPICVYQLETKKVIRAAA